jgi:hypothetical protein
MASVLLGGAADIFEQGGDNVPRIKEDTVWTLHVDIGVLSVAIDFL